MPNSFVWYELMTTDAQAARAFYADVIGWTAKPWGDEADPYLLMGTGGVDAAGIMRIPDQAQGAPPMWVGYIGVDDVDAKSEAVAKAGGSVKRPPADIPNVGRFSVVTDPQGATFMLMTPLPGDYPPPPPMSSPGRVGWHELYAADWEKAFDFYAGQFGWTKDQALDMGPMGTYQMIAAGDGMFGAMMNKPPEARHSSWVITFNVPAIDATAERVKAGGGTIVMPPVEVPGGQWACQALDPQGALFGLVASGR